MVKKIHNLIKPTPSSNKPNHSPAATSEIRNKNPPKWLKNFKTINGPIIETSAPVAASRLLTSKINWNWFSLPLPLQLHHVVWRVCKFWISQQYNLKIQCRLPKHQQSLCFKVSISSTINRESTTNSRQNLLNTKGSSWLRKINNSSWWKTSEHLRVSMLNNSNI